MGMFSDTIMEWREPNGILDFVFLKEDGIQRTRGKFTHWSSYGSIERCCVDRAGINPVLRFSPRKKRFFYILGPVDEVTVSPDISLDAVLGILRYKGVQVSAEVKA